MRKLILVTVLSAALLGAASPVSAQKGVDIKGTVLEMHPDREEDGPVIFNVILQGEGPWRAHLRVRPADVKAYATVGGLRRGDTVSAVCLKEGRRYWIKEITKEGHVELPEEEIDEEEREHRERQERIRHEIERRVRREMERREREDDDDDDEDDRDDD